MRRLPLRRLFLPIAAIGLAASACRVQAQIAGAEAIAACERAARQTLGPQAEHGEVTFDAAPTVQESLSNESQTVLRGAGHWRSATGMRTFGYSCNVDPSTAKAVGLVLRDSTRAAAPAAPQRAPAEPNLSELSPDACESSAVEALRQRWPHVSKINFDPGTRVFRQESADRAELHGSGLALPAPGAPNTLFGFDCAIDPRDGRVLRTSVSG